VGVKERTEAAEYGIGLGGTQEVEQREEQQGGRKINKTKA